MNIDVLLLPERVQLAIKLGESHFREFKSAWEGRPSKKTRRDVKSISIDIARTLVAFANADGGELLVGVEDDGEITGIDLTDEQMATLLDAPIVRAHKDTPLPPVRSIRLTMDTKVILYFAVSKGTNYVYLTSDGRCLQRRDRESVPIASEVIRFSRTETMSREYDRGVVDNAGIDDLDLEWIGIAAESISKGMSVEKCLQHLELAEFDGTKLRLRRAALILFAKDSVRWHPRLQVRILKVEGNVIKAGDKYNVTKDEDVSGNILSLIKSSWDLLRPHLAETRFSRGALFKTQIIYPELACREGLINAIVHRDYSNEGRGIEVRVFTDRMEIVSPGELLSSISIDDLRQQKGVHESRNALISRVLRELGYMRELGEGIRRIYELMQSSDLTAPELESGNNVFTMTLSHRLVYTGEEKIWLENFADYDLSRDERTVVRLGYGDRLVSPKAIWDACGIVDTDYYRRLLESLREKGILYSDVRRGAAYRLASVRDIPKKAVPRFAIQVPKSAHIERPAEKVAPAAAIHEAIDGSDYSVVHVRNLPSKAQRQELESLFAQFGDVSDVTIPTDRVTSKNRGYGFVEFDTRRAAKLAIAKSGQITLRGRTLRVQEAVSRAHERAAPKGRTTRERQGLSRPSEATDARRVFIANVGPQATEEELLQVMARYGDVLHLLIPVDPDSAQQRTFAFVTFKESDSARSAIEHSGQIVLGGRVLYLQEYTEKPIDQS